MPPPRYSAKNGRSAARSSQLRIRFRTDAQHRRSLQVSVRGALDSGQNIHTPRDGATDRYPSSGEYTTHAQAEGAIEGTYRDYIVATPFSTDFKYSKLNARSKKMERSKKRLPCQYSRYQRWLEQKHQGRPQKPFTQKVNGNKKDMYMHMYMCW